MKQPSCGYALRLTSNIIMIICITQIQTIDSLQRFTMGRPSTCSISAYPSLFYHSEWEGRDFAACYVVYSDPVLSFP